ncbi:WD40/YVTN/BNR-like repeat-containing protein [Haloferula sp. A504]|uniref:WD40/YVTN/BNR-like repeat-containing protein n=1 Tax=Haloferula sp. A504 TaxID=3373601 RepID=UPI0031C6DB46|nr:hypothetical protein [Verrucomicrobiaceae bacterium E54]
MLAIATALAPHASAASPPGILWERKHFQPEHAELQATASNGAGVIVAVGNGGVIRRSTDAGLTWDTPQPDSQLDLTDICWDGSRFVAVGGEGFVSAMVMTSPDGQIWRRSCLGSGQLLSSVASDGSTLVAMGYNARCYTSGDGLSWSATPSGTDDYSSVAWNGSLFVRVGSAGLIETSPDGSSWTPRPSGTTKAIDAVTSDGSGFVAVGYDWEAAAPLVLTSPDGITWSVVDMSAFPLSPLRTVTWTGSRFVAASTADKIFTSPDGTTWDHHAAGPTMRINGLHWTGSHLFALGEGGLILRSDQAAPAVPANWTTSAEGSTPPTFLDLIETEIGGTHRIVVVGTQGSISYSDDDGESGSDVTPVTSRSLNGITVTPFPSRRFITVGDSGTILLSETGTSWTTETSGTGNTLRAVTWADFINPATPDRAIAVGEYGTILTGEATIHGWVWTSRTSGTSEALRGVALGSILTGKPPVSSSLAVAVGLSGTILTSPDGVTWTPRSSGTLDHLFQVIAIPTGGFLAVGSHGVVLRSINGTTWTLDTTGEVFALRDVTRTAEGYVAVGYGGAIYTSGDGQTWTRRYGRTHEMLHAILPTHTGRLIASAEGGIIVTSDPAPDFGDWIAAQAPPPGMDGPDDDPNGDGVPNLLAYGFGIPAVAPATAADFARLLRWDAASGQLRLAPDSSDPPDILYILEQSPDLGATGWSEIFRLHPGQECGTGQVHIHIDPTGYGFVELPAPLASTPSSFYRLQVIEAD